MQTEQRVKPTLKRTKYACVNCKAAKAACDSNRPCAWCIRHALQDSCVDAPRKTRTSKKICCDPSLHQSKNVVFKQEYKGFPIPLANDFTSSTVVPVAPPLSPPNEIFPIEDFLAPGVFDFGLNTVKGEPCSNCPLFATCARDAPQRLICATSASPPQSPLSPEGQDDEDESSPLPPTSTISTPPTLSLSTPPTLSLSTHPDYCLLTPPTKQPTPSQTTPPITEPAHTPATTTYSPAELLASSPAQPQQPQQPTQATSTPSPQCSPALYTQQGTPQTPGTPQQQQQQQKSPAATSPAPSPSTSQCQIAVQQPTRTSCCSASFSNLPPLLDDNCNCQALVQREMAKINACLDTISALMQLQNVSQLPTATFHLPDTALEDCNDEFAKALGYDGRDDLVGSSNPPSPASPASPASPSQELTTIKPRSHTKLTLTSLVPEKNVGQVLRCASNLMRSSMPSINQIVFSTKRGDTKYFTVLIKPCGYFSYISILKQHQDVVEGLGMCGE